MVTLWRKETLLAYNVAPPSDIPSDIERAANEFKANMPKAHHKFFNNLQISCMIDDYYFVHAGIDPEKSLDTQDDMTQMTVRAKFLNYPKSYFGKRIIHGHTPAEAPEILTHRVNLDTGAYLTNQLTLAVLYENMVKILT